MQEKSNNTKEKIVELYGDYLLKYGEKPKNIYLFVKENDFEEKEFYHYFAGFEQIEKEILNHLFIKSWQLSSEINFSDQLATKEKLLNVYYIFFENLTMNRSLVLLILGTDKFQKIKVLNSLRETHKEFISTLDFDKWEIIEKAKQDIQKLSEKTRYEALWLHLISSIEFWIKDTSPDFEKTDIFIEKTIDTGFTLMDNEPLKKVFDLGKFLWKEKFTISW